MDMDDYQPRSQVRDKALDLNTASYLKQHVDDINDDQSLLVALGEEERHKIMTAMGEQTGTDTSNKRHHNEIDSQTSPENEEHPSKKSKSDPDTPTTSQGRDAQHLKHEPQSSGQNESVPCPTDGLGDDNFGGATGDDRVIERETYETTKLLVEHGIETKKVDDADTNREGIETPTSPTFGAHQPQQAGSEIISTHAEESYQIPAAEGEALSTALFSSANDPFNLPAPGRRCLVDYASSTSDDGENTPNTESVAIPSKLQPTSEDEPMRFHFSAIEKGDPLPSVSETGGIRNNVSTIDNLNPDVRRKSTSPKNIVSSVPAGKFQVHVDGGEKQLQNPETADVDMGSSQERLEDSALTRSSPRSQEGPSTATSQLEYIRSSTSDSGKIKEEGQFFDEGIPGSNTFMHEARSRMSTDMSTAAEKVKDFSPDAEKTEDTRISNTANKDTDNGFKLEWETNIKNTTTSAKLEGEATEVLPKDGDTLAGLIGVNSDKSEAIDKYTDATSSTMSALVSSATVPPSSSLPEGMTKTSEARIPDSATESCSNAIKKEEEKEAISIPHHKDSPAPGTASEPEREPNQGFDEINTVRTSQGVEVPPSPNRVLGGMKSIFGSEPREPPAPIPTIHSEVLTRVSLGKNQNIFALSFRKNNQTQATSEKTLTAKDKIEPILADTSSTTFMASNQQQKNKQPEQPAARVTRSKGKNALQGPEPSTPKKAAMLPMSTLPVIKSRSIDLTTSDSEAEPEATSAKAAKSNLSKSAQGKRIADDTITPVRPTKRTRKNGATTESNKQTATPAHKGNGDKSSVTGGGHQVQVIISSSPNSDETPKRRKPSAQGRAPGEDADYIPTEDVEDAPPFSPNGRQTAKRHLTPTVVPQASGTTNKQRANPRQEQPGPSTSICSVDDTTRQSSVFPKKMQLPTKGFPRFPDGDVYIQLDLQNDRTGYCLHSSLLSRVSPWFADELQKQIVEVDEQKARQYQAHTKIKARFESQFDFKERKTSFSRFPFTALKALQGNTDNIPSINLEDGNAQTPQVSEMSEQQMVDDRGYQDSIDAYRSVLNACYSMPIIINKDNITKALLQAETILKVAETLGTKHVVRPYLLSELLSHGHDTYRSIMYNPQRWLKIAVDLQNYVIFQEAMIHIVGNLRRWRSKTIDKPGFHPYTANLIERKAAELKSKKMEVDSQLFTSYICIDNKAIGLDDLDNSTSNTWMAVQYWRDWYSRSLATAAASKTSCIDGKMYREMAKAGEEYLSISTLAAAVMRWKGEDKLSGYEVMELGEDLQMMKEAAQRASQPLCINHSLLSVEDAKIFYFTCIKIDKDEVPWKTT